MTGRATAAVAHATAVLARVSAPARQAVPEIALRLVSLHGDASRVPMVAVAVYVAFSADAEVLYSGSTYHRHRGLFGRIREHLQLPERRRSWKYLGIVVLPDDTPSGRVLDLEAVVGGLLGGTAQLPQSTRLPRLWG